MKTTDMYTLRDFPGGSVVKNLPAHAGDAGSKVSFTVLGRFHGQRSLAGYIQSIGSQQVKHN